jgi:hypothetical protein
MCTSSGELAVDGITAPKIIELDLGEAVIAILVTNKDYGVFPIAITIPARTMIAEIEAHWECGGDNDF